MLKRKKRPSTGGYLTNWQIDNNSRFRRGWYEKERRREGGGGGVVFVLEREKGREKGCVREGVRKIFDKIFFFWW